MDSISNHTKIFEGDILSHSPLEQQTQMVVPYKLPLEDHHVEKHS